ncbi:8626_t:CDS:2 [Acaulospora morrowiae]|uniref:8626_t:CDS:1 n=1 Tax=Acaulospora morrowiae TaxID=94023 RepID=A0A9N8ZG31_9GLOM|nr:8626_t:CDS:2 [Acaulospora morrowiae]
MALTFNTKLFALLAIFVLLSFNIDSGVSAPHKRPHQNHANTNNATVYSGDGTFYEVGLGACGITNTDDQLICALNYEMFDPATPLNNPNKNPNCGKKIKICRGAREVIVTIYDRCAGCKYGDIDLSPAAFCKIADPSEGRVPITWSYID